MGNCCHKDKKDAKDVNLTTRGGGRLSFKGDDMFLLVKCQSMIRGYLARKKVKKIYGFSASPGLINRTTLHIEMDPAKLEEQRMRV